MRVSLRPCVAALVLAFGVSASSLRAQPTPAALPSFAEPSVSPDHATIAFVSGGDVWTVPAAGGAARLLVATGGTAARPIYAPDGKSLAFVAARRDAIGIYRVVLDGGAITRLTHDDVTPELDGWSADGRYVYFSSSAHNIAYFGDIMRVAADGGTPVRAISERFVNAMMAAPAPDGRATAYVRNGFVQWWRRGHSHIDQDEIVVADSDHRYATLTGGEAKDRWPMWSPDGSVLYFVSDRSGSDELWSRGAAGALRRLTSLGGEPVLWPTISRDGRTIAFEHAFGIWTYDVASGAVRHVPIELVGGVETPSTQHVTATNRFTALSLSPDDKKFAFVARAKVFVAGNGTDAPSQLVTTDPSAAYDLPVWSNDSRRVAYTIDRGTDQSIAIAELPDGPQRRLTPPGHHDYYPHWSPDGTQLAFVRDGRELHLLTVATQADRVVARGFLDRQPFGDNGDIAFSPAGDWIAYIDNWDGFSNVRVVRPSGGEAHAISFLPNGSAGPLVWAPDGKRLFFVTAQRTENGQIAQIDLVPRQPQFAEDALRKLFPSPPSRNELPSKTVPTPVPVASPAGAVKRPASTPAKLTPIDFDGIRDRLTFLPTGLDVTGIAAPPDGLSLVLVANAATEQNLYAFPIDDTSDEPPVARQLTSTPGQKSNVALTSDGKTVVYLDAGAIFSVGLDGSKPKRAMVGAEFDTAFARDKLVVFEQAWSLLDRWYADPHFHGADWPAVERTYAPHALGAQTPQEFARIVNLMLGELNSSHLGFRGPRAPGTPVQTGRLGAQWDSDAYERTGQLRIAEIAPLGPLALVGGVHTGDAILAVNDNALNRTTDIDELLANTVGKRTLLRIAPHGDSNAARSVVVLPIDTQAEQGLWYRGWVLGRRAYVDRISGGRLGYVHVPDMSQASLERFYTDLDLQNRAKDGVIVDIRNNEGGFVDPYAIDVLTRRAYARFKSRFGSDPSERSSLGQRVLEKPTALVVNEHSLSDAENFTEAYRVLHAGPVVGVPTAGWIIFTSAADLADGSAVRLPSTLVFGRDGVDMELHPRPVDIRVDNPPGAAAAGDDPQLAAAVRRLLRGNGR